jgi:hypothetical protein
MTFELESITTPTNKIQAKSAIAVTYRDINLGAFIMIDRRQAISAVGVENY